MTGRSGRGWPSTCQVSRLDADDALRLVFYSESALPGVGISLDVLESDGSRYGLDLDRA